MSQYTNEDLQQDPLKLAKQAEQDLNSYQAKTGHSKAGHEGKGPSDSGTIASLACLSESSLVSPLRSDRKGEWLTVLNYSYRVRREPGRARALPGCERAVRFCCRRGE